MASVSRRRLFLDQGLGERRGVLTIDGRAHRLLIERPDNQPSQALGARSTARVTRIERGLGVAFLQMPDGPDAMLPLGAAPAPVEGSSIEVEVSSEARADKPGAPKAVVVRRLDDSLGPPRLLSEAPPLKDRLSALAPETGVIEGRDACEACDIAQDEVLALTHALLGGGSICIEPTRALIAVDVDMGERAGGDLRRAARQTNLTAIAETARLLRLKGLGGLVVIDLVGKGHDGAAMSEAARTAFAAEGAGVVLGPITRFGLFELAVPRTTRPIAERLLDATGQISALTAAFAMLRALEREGRAEPGARLVAHCGREVADAAKDHLTALAARIGPRFQVETREGMERRFEVAVP